MHNLTIQSSIELKILSTQFNIAEQELKDKIINTFINREAIGGDQDECGKTLGEIADEPDFRSVCLQIFKNVSHVLLTNISNLVILSTLGDCPQCGCETTEEEQGAFDRVWVETECSNCDYRDSNEPDWDTIRGGHAYDC